MRARGVPENPPGRFEVLRAVPTGEEASRLEGRELPTELLVDPSRRIVARNDSPDVGFDASVNPYRGCEHACVYCYARPTHEYLGLSAGLDFETRILVKPRAPELLRRELASPRWRPRVLALSGVTDAYQPAERRLRITRGCLEVLAESRNPVAIITKSFLVTRDVDLLQELAAHRAASVAISVTTLDAALQRSMEPRAAPPRKRLEAMERLPPAGVPVGVMVAPVVPGLTEHEAPRILRAAAEAGASFAGRVVLRLPHGLKEIFGNWLERTRPERRRKVESRIRAIRGGRLYDTRWSVRQRGEGFHADQMEALFELARRRAGLAGSGPELSTESFRPPGCSQLPLFGR